MRWGPRPPPLVSSVASEYLVKKKIKPCFNSKKEGFPDNSQFLYAPAGPLPGWTRDAATRVPDESMGKKMAKREFRKLPDCFEKIAVPRGCQNLAECWSYRPQIISPGRPSRIPKFPTPPEPPTPLSNSRNSGFRRQTFGRRKFTRNSSRMLRKRAK